MFVKTLIRNDIEVAVSGGEALEKTKGGVLTKGYEPYLRSQLKQNIILISTAPSELGRRN